ncbi:MAG: choline/ethanolamine kinase family protein [Rhodoferax sp.]
MDPQTRDRIRSLPCWQGTPRLAPLDGGMTNHNFLVQDGAARYVLRLGVDLPEHGVLRTQELAAARAAQALGLSPEVVHAEPGLMVSRYIAGRTLTPVDLRNPRQLEPALALLRRCHAGMPALLPDAAARFDVFAVLRGYLQRLRAQPGPLPDDRLDVLEALAQRLELRVPPLAPVFGHNDLLAANFIDDGQRLWLIDWDYAGYGNPLFDLANLSTNNGFDAALDQELLRLYGDVAPDPGWVAGLQAMQTASLLREALWAAVSAQHRRVAFDYAGYLRDCLDRLDRHLAGTA